MITKKNQHSAQRKEKARFYQKLEETGADLIVANDIGSRYQKNPNNNNVIIVEYNSEKKAIKTKNSGWKRKDRIAKFIRKEIESKLK